MYWISRLIKDAAKSIGKPPDTKIPFRVNRTASDNMPVYTIKRFNKALIYTQVRKVRGDVESVRREISYICRSPARVIADGVIEVNGNHRTILKEWLSNNGF
jgi:translation initiation factor 1 (eIF-1/SUI1)